MNDSNVSAPDDGEETRATNGELCRRLSWFAFLAAVGVGVASLLTLVIGVKAVAAGHGTSTVWIIGMILGVLFVISSATSIMAGVSAARGHRSGIAWWVFVDAVALLILILVIIFPDMFFSALGL